MGNAESRERKRPGSRALDGSQPATPTTGTHGNLPSPNPQAMFDARQQQLLGSFLDRETSIQEGRRETKQEREARRLERELAQRAIERERSWREEHVDGGYLVTQGIYRQSEDFSKPVVRRLMIERKIAPFWRYLEDHSDSWVEHQLIAAARGRPIPPPDEVPEDLMPRPSPARDNNRSSSAKNIKNLTVPTSSTSKSPASSSTNLPSAHQPTLTPTSTSAPGASSGSSLFSKPRKALALRSLTSTYTSSSRNPPTEDPQLRELRLPDEPTFNSQPIEVHLYKEVVECPVCCNLYPPYLNRTRCCDQDICSECFVQLKRPDPHPPQHVVSSQPHSPPEQSEELVTEPAACPNCRTPYFGVTYNPPPFRRGLFYPNMNLVMNSPSTAMSSRSSLLSSPPSGAQSPMSADGSHRRVTSLSANSPLVTTVDDVRPDWQEKLNSANRRLRSRSDAASALHQAAYPAGGFHELGGGSRGLGRLFGRSGSMPSPLSPDDRQALAITLERLHRSSGSEGGALSTSEGAPRHISHEDAMLARVLEESRRTAAEEERRRNKEKEKQDKKAAKKAKKAQKKRSSSAGPLERDVELDHPGPATRLQSGVEISDGYVDTSSRSSLSNHSVRELNRLDSRQSTDFGPQGPQGHLERARAQLNPGRSQTSPDMYGHTASYARNHSYQSSTTSSVSLAESDNGLPGSNQGSAASFEGTATTGGVYVPTGALPHALGSRNGDFEDQYDTIETMIRNNRQVEEHLDSGETTEAGSAGSSQNDMEGASEQQLGRTVSQNEDRRSSFTPVSQGYRPSSPIPQ